MHTYGRHAYERRAYEMAVYERHVYELYKLCNYSFLKNHVALVVVGKLVGEIFDVALTSLLPAVHRIISAVPAAFR